MKKSAYLIAMVMLMVATSCEKTYKCKCSVAMSEKSEILEVSAWNKARAEVKCMQNNTADPTTAGNYNCSLTETALP